MNKTTVAIAPAQTTTAAHSGNLTGIVLAAFVGFGLLLAAGFAQASVLHDGAHDTRHAIAFPCH